jgi:hypothetical protein
VAGFNFLEYQSTVRVEQAHRVVRRIAVTGSDDRCVGSDGCDVDILKSLSVGAADARQQRTVGRANRQVVSLKVEERFSPVPWTNTEGARRRNLVPRRDEPLIRECQDGTIGNIRAVSRLA